MLETSRAETGGDPAGRSAQRGPGRGPGGFVRRHGLVSFYVLAYAMSWVAWLPYVLSQYGLGVLHIPIPQFLGAGELAGQLVGGLLGAYLGPLGAAFIVTAVSEGRPGLGRWAGRLLKWGVNWKWYALALLGVPAVIVAGTLAVSPGAVAGLRLPPPEALLLYVPFLLFQVLTTGLAEEPGWRDFALVRHQRQHGPLLGTLILGVLWAGWHLPLFLTDWGAGIGGANPRSILVFVGFCVVFSFVITWVFNRTRESLPLAMLTHTGINNFFSVMFVFVFPTVDLARYGLLGALIGFGALALVLLAATRGRLGYEREDPADGPAKAA